MQCNKKNIRIAGMFFAFIMAMSLFTANVFAEDVSVDYWTVDLPDSTLVVFDITASSVGAMNATLTSLESAITALDNAMVVFAGPSPYATEAGARKRGGPNDGNGEAALRAQLVAAIPDLEDADGNIRPYVFAWTRAAFINPATLTATNGGLAAGDVVQLRQMGAAGVGTVTQTTFRTAQSTHPMIRLMEELQMIYIGPSTPQKDALTTIVNNIPDLADGGNIRPFVLTWTRTAFINPATLSATNGGLAAGDVVQIRQMGAAGVGTVTQTTFRTTQSTHPMIMLMEALRGLPKS